MEEFNSEVLKDIQIESYVLGGMMNTKGYYISIDYKLTENDFYYTKNKILFNAIKQVFEENSIVDFILVTEKLKNSKELEVIGGISYISHVSSSCLSIGNLDAYIDKLKEYSSKRKYYELSKFIIGNLDKDVKDLQAESTKIILNAIDENESMEDSKIQGEKFIKYLEEVEKGKAAEIKTYISPLDRVIGGFNRGNLVTIFAFSNVGKTSLALQIALNNIRMKKKVLFFSLEMQMEELRGRLITNLTNIDYKKIMFQKDKEANEFENILKANDLLSCGLTVSSEDNLNNITSKILYEVVQNDVDIIFIDYINLITIAGFNKEEHQKNAICTRELKKLALKINKPIVIIAQAKQEVASKMNNNNLEVYDKLSVNDVAGGSSIFRDSDIVLGMYRNIELDNPSVRQDKADIIDYSSLDADVNPECANILVKKARASGKGIVSVKYIGDRFRISNWN